MLFRRRKKSLLTVRERQATRTRCRSVRANASKPSEETAGETMKEYLCKQIKRDLACEAPAAYRYTWPGRDESFICEGCAPQLKRVADAMGLHVQLIRIIPEE